MKDNLKTLRDAAYSYTMTQTTASIPTYDTTASYDTAASSATSTMPPVEQSINKMFKMQYELQKFLGTDFYALSRKQAAALIKEHTLMAQIELGEMLNEMPFLKAWKNYDTMSGEEVTEAFDKVREEYIDVIHFIMNIGLLLGMDGDDVFRAYSAKNVENYERQKNKWNEGTHYTYKR